MPFSPIDLTPTSTKRPPRGRQLDYDGDNDDVGDGDGDETSAKAGSGRVPVKGDVRVAEIAEDGGDVVLPWPWFPVLENECDFGPDDFLSVALNIVENPNITSSHLFRADILYDDGGEDGAAGFGLNESDAITIRSSLSSSSASPPGLVDDWKDRYCLRPDDALPGLHRRRTFVRRLVPRNPQLDRPIAQTCQVYTTRSEVKAYANEEDSGQKEPLRRPKQIITAIVMIPHVSKVEDLPWYHPSVRAVAYVHRWKLHSEENSPLDDEDRSSKQQTHHNHYQQQQRRRRQSSGDDGEHPSTGGTSATGRGLISIHYELFPGQEIPLSDRLMRTARNLLGTLYKHGQGSLRGYTKQFHHDLLISQKRVQDTYTELKLKYAKRLCEKWVEKTDPSKHVFEDLGIAAFLIELWKDMYAPPWSSSSSRTGSTAGSGKLGRLFSQTSRTASSSSLESQSQKTLPPFPGFVDIGCGNGLLTEILLLSGYPGWGFDARRRKTWATLSASSQKNLYEMILIPQPLQEPPPPSEPPSSSSSCSSCSSLSPSRSPFSSSSSVHQTGQLGRRSRPSTRKSRFLSPLSRSRSNSRSSRSPSAVRPSRGDKHHNGIFPPGTFIISNHADELTPWTPLLAALSESPFLAIPCCSHNLSGDRFRAPSAANSQTADHAAPSYFDEQKARARTKSIPIAIAIASGTEEADDADSSSSLQGHDRSAKASEVLTYGTSGSSKLQGASGNNQFTKQSAESGDLRSLAPSVRNKQPSAYSSLCDWVEHLANRVGYEVEREMLRIPSTRNVGLIGRVRRQHWQSDGDASSAGAVTPTERVREIVRREGADKARFVKRCEETLQKGGAGEHTCWKEHKEHIPIG